MSTPPLTVAGRVTPGPRAPQSTSPRTPRARVIALGVRVGQVRRDTQRPLIVEATASPSRWPDDLTTPLYDTVAQSMGVYGHTVASPLSYHTTAEHGHTVAEFTDLQWWTADGHTVLISAALPTLAALTPLPLEDL